MKSPNVLLTATLATGLVLGSTACTTVESHPELDISCGAYAVPVDEITVQSLAKTIRLCYDHAPETLSEKSGGNGIKVRIPTSDGKQVNFVASSKASINSSADTYAEQASLVGFNYYDTKTSFDGTLSVPTASISFSNNQAVPFTIWTGPKSPQDKTKKSIRAGAVNATEVPSVEVDFNSSEYGLNSLTDPATVACVQNAIIYQLDGAIRNTSNHKPQKPVQVPDITDQCRND